jgi:hypothetical protein
MSTALVQPVLIAVLVILEVARLAGPLATRGRKRSAAVLGAVNAVPAAR